MQHASRAAKASSLRASQDRRRRPFGQHERPDVSVDVDEAHGQREKIAANLSGNVPDMSFGWNVGPWRRAPDPNVLASGLETLIRVERDRPFDGRFTAGVRNVRGISVHDDANSVAAPRPGESIANSRRALRRAEKEGTDPRKRTSNEHFVSPAR